MKKVFIVTAVCIYIAGLCILGYCQDNKPIGQSESQMGQSLDSKVSSEQTQNTAKSDKTSTELEQGKMGQSLDSRISSEKAQNTAESDKASAKFEQGKPGQ